MILAAPKNRYQAFAVHLLISFVLFVFLASIIYFIWYPGFLFWAAGGIDGMKLIAGVDLVIGPFLTLCLYRVGKKGLKFDMAIRQADLFPTLLVQMTSIGEESGALDDMLEKVAEHYEAEVDNKVDNLTTLLEPLIMSVLGILVGGLMIAMYMPIFQLGAVI